MKRSPRTTLRRLALLGSSTLLSALLLEGTVRLSGIDRRLLERALYYQLADPPVHRVSADSFLHYELRPGARLQHCEGHNCATVTINAAGARGPERDVARTPGTFRVLFLGGSTTYGANVGDDQTMPAALERILNRDAPSGLHTEVWNFGTSAYTLAQAAWLARHKLDTLRPDLVLVQLYNQGRRAFLPMGGGSREDGLFWLREDAEFIPENFPPPPSGLTAAAHARAMRSLALYRAVEGWRRRRGDASRSAYGDALSRREASALTAAATARGIEVVYVAIPAMLGGFSAHDVFPSLSEARFVDLYVPQREPAFYLVHPPAPYLTGYAEEIASTLRARGLLPR